MTAQCAVSDARLADLGVNHLEAVRAVFYNEDLYTLAEILPTPDYRRGGRPRIYPNYLVKAFGDLADIFNSVRMAATTLNDPEVWAMIDAIVREMFPNQPSMWLPEKPPCRTWYYRRKAPVTDTVSANPDNDRLEALRREFSATGVGTARELGHLDPNGPGSATHPDASRMITHDGKAIAQMFKGAPGDTREVKVIDPETGAVSIEERPVRADPDAKTHMTGDKRVVVGSKFWKAEVRGDAPYTRVTVAVDYVPGVKNEHSSEADIAVKNLLDLAPRVPGAQGVISDTAMRGVHIDKLQRETGWIIMNPVTAEAVDPKTGDRTEKEAYLRTETLTYPDGTTLEIDIWRSGGALCRHDYAFDGTPFLERLPRVLNRITQNIDGMHRSYVEYRLDDPRGELPPSIIREPTFQRDEDGAFNRAENIRQIPPGDPDYERLKGRRSDSEASNRVVDDHLYLRRARSLGARRQLWDLICHYFVQNSIARYRHRMKHGPPSALAA
jgi:hypothetical protein